MAAVTRRPAAASKRPAASLLSDRPSGLLKRPAGRGEGSRMGEEEDTVAAAVSKKEEEMANEDEEHEEEEQEVEEERSMLKRPASRAGSLLKRPATVEQEAPPNLTKRSVPAGEEASAVEDKEGVAAEEEKGGEEEEPKGGAATAGGRRGAATSGGTSQAAEARATAVAVQRQQRLLDKLYAERDTLAKRVKSNRDTLRCVEQEMEELKKTAVRKAIAAGRVRSAERKRKLEIRTGRARALMEKASSILKTSKKRLDGMREANKASQRKAEDADVVLQRASRKYDEAKARCAELAAQGEEVPEDGLRDLTAPSAWKPPGVQASKDRAVAKVAWERAKSLWEKATATAQVLEKKYKLVKDQMDSAKEKRRIAEETMEGKEGGSARKAAR